MSFWRVWLSKKITLTMKQSKKNLTSVNNEMTHKVGLDKYDGINLNWCQFERYSDPNYNTNNETVPNVFGQVLQSGYQPIFTFWTMKHILTWLAPNISIVQKFLTILSLWTRIDLEVNPMDSSSTPDVLE